MKILTGWTIRSFIMVSVLLICVWIFAPRPAKKLPETAIFNNVRVISAGTRFLTLSRYSEARGDRFEIRNMSNFYSKIKEFKKNDSEVDVSMLPNGTKWEIVAIKEATPLPPLPGQ